MSDFEQFSYSVIPLSETSEFFSPRDLFLLIASAFKDTTNPIHSRTLFTLEASPFTVGSSHDVNPSITPDKMEMCILTMCNILGKLDSRSEVKEGDNPRYDVKTVRSAYSNIASLWLSIHGALGVDGHGRTLSQLYYITMEVGGYNQLFQSSQFLDDVGKYDHNKSITSLLLQGSIGDGIRLLASMIQTLETGMVDELLLNPNIIDNHEAKKAANKLAMPIIMKFLLHKTGEILNSKINR